MLLRAFMKKRAILKAKTKKRKVDLSAWDVSRHLL